MTSLEASIELYKWFSENDSFCLEEDFKKVITITENLERDKASLLSALEDFVKNEMISRVEIKDTKYWILRKSFASFNQSVSISPDLAMGMSLILNKFHENMEAEIQQCDPSSLGEKDIKNLFGITNFLIQKINVDKEEKED